MCGRHAEVDHGHSAARVVPDGEGQVVPAVGTAGDRLRELHTAEEILSVKREELRCITPDITPASWPKHAPKLTCTSKDILENSFRSL